MRPLNLVFSWLVILPTFLDARFIHNYYAQRSDTDLKDNVSDKYDLCVTEECINLAGRLKVMLDTTVDPCEDFYKFTCGNFLKIKIPSTISSLSTFTFIKNSVVQRLKEQLESPNQNSDPLFVNNLKTFFKMCSNDVKKETDNLPALIELLNKLKGWPVVVGKKWDEEPFDWVDFLNQYHELGFSTEYLFTLKVGVNLRNSSIQMLQIDAAKTIVDGRRVSQDLKNNSFITSYHKFMVDMAVLMGADRETATKELWDIVVFEAVIAKGKYLRRNDENFVVWTLKKLGEKNKNIPWKKLIDKLLAYTNFEFTDDEEITIVNEGFLTTINDIIPSAPNRIIANYLIWRAILSVINELPQEFRDIMFEFRRTGLQIPSKTESWVLCISTISQLYNFALGYLYVKYYFDPEAQRQAEKIVVDIKKEMRESLLWLDESSREEAIKKLEVMDAYVGYPQELMEDKKVQQHYGDIEIKPTDKYIEVLLKLRKHFSQVSFKNMRSLVNKKDWKLHAEVTDVNAFYNVVENSIYLPAAVLQGSFFGKQRPDYFNYAGIGFVIGHEMTHAYDIQGSLFDYDGNMRDWWSAASKSRYIGRADCIGKEFDEFVVKQVNQTINGKRTASENMADIGGLKAAYSAYFKKKTKEMRIFGLEEFSSRQLFWINAATIWCTNYRDKALKSLLMSGEHAPGEFRVNGAFAHQAAFAKDFNCPLGSMMNPKDKCSVWEL